MFWKISILGFIMAVILSGCADKSTPEHTVKRFIGAVKSGDEQIISELMDYDRILVQVKVDEYADMSPEEKKVEIGKIRQSMLKALTVGDLSIIKSIKPVITRSEVDEDEFGKKAFVVVRDKSENGGEFAFVLSNVDGSWKIFLVMRKPA